MLKELSTLDEVVAELGGKRAVMELLGVTSASAVPVWKHRGKFPDYTHRDIQNALKAKGAVARDDLWKMRRA